MRDQARLWTWPFILVLIINAFNGVASYMINPILPDYLAEKGVLFSVIGIISSLISWIALVFQAVGATTLKLSRKQEGDCLAAILGPLGNPTHIEKVGTVVCVGGGIGVAPLHPIVQAYKAAGNKVIVIMGARNKDLLIFENEMRALADELIIMTDDGSFGEKGTAVSKFFEDFEEARPDLILSCGPTPMLRALKAGLAERKIETPCFVSLEERMGCGIGACLVCVCKKSGSEENARVCKDGPVFDINEVEI